MEKPADVEIGSYVLGTKFTDGDPGDPWGIGIYAGSYEHFGTIRHHINMTDGTPIYPRRGFERVGRITDEFGNWLYSVRHELERSPPGTVNLWGMLGVRATPEQDEQDAPHV